MNITLYCHDIFKNVIINHIDDIYSYINIYFNIDKSNQILKLNDKLFTADDYHLLNNNDLIFVEQKKRHSLIQIIGEYKYQFKMIIDTGAQNNVMSVYLANILNLAIDTKHKGIAHGIGQAKIVGNTSVDIKINQKIYHLTFNVIESDINDITTKYLVLLGLDFLSTYQCDISLKNKTITINNEIINLLNDYQLYQYEHPVKLETRIENQYRQLNLKLEEHRTLKNILTKIIDNPYDDKYKSINTNSETFKKYLVKCIDLMKIVGFTESNQHMKFTNNIQNLQELIEIM